MPFHHLGRMQADRSVLGRRPESGRGFAFAALLLALAGSLFLAFAPSVQEQSMQTVVSGGGVQTHSSSSSRTLLDVEGASVLIALAIPVAITAVAFALSRTRAARVVATIGAVLLSAFSILGAMTIGLLYFPAAGALTLASLRRRSSFSETFPPAPPAPS
jgi:hypothetical protein